MFIDRVKIRIEGGHGGNGVTAFRREKFVPRGGPSGGEGGRGGDVWIVGDSSLNTLLHLRYNPLHIAGRGLHGEGSNRSGKEGADVIVRVPVGTQVFDPQTNELLFDCDADGQRWLAAHGGRGDFRTFVIADIPGLIEGAHEGHGLGDRFLRHVERTKLLLHLVDMSSVSGRDPVSDYEVINRELAAYDRRLAERPQIVVATKIDALDEPERVESLRRRADQDERNFFAISSVTGAGVRELINAVGHEIEEMRAHSADRVRLDADDALLVGSGNIRSW